MRGKDEAGFTRTPEIRAILDKYERRDRDGKLITPVKGGTASWEELTVDDAIRLLERLPDWQREMRQNESPTIREMIRIGLRYPGTRFFGYRVPEEREDERISFEGFLLSKESVPRYEAEELYERLSPDSSRSDLDQGDYWHLWWD